VAFFRLAKASTYEWRSKKSGKLYVFSGDSVAKVEHPDDLTRFRMLKPQFVETDETGKMILTQTSPSDIPMAFTRHGMVAPKSYSRLEKAANKAAAQASPPPPVNPPAEPRVSRTVTSSKAVETTEAPSPVVSTPPAAKTVEEPAPASAHVEEKAAAAAPSPSAIDTGAAAQSGPAPADGVPQVRTRRRRSRGVAAQ